MSRSIPPRPSQSERDAAKRTIEDLQLLTALCRFAAMLAAFMFAFQPTSAAGQSVVRCSPVGRAQPVNTTTTMLIRAVIPTGFAPIPLAIVSAGLCPARVAAPAVARCVDGWAEIALAPGQREAIVSLDVPGTAEVYQRVVVAGASARCEATLPLTPVVDNGLFASSGPRAGWLRAPVDQRQASSLMSYVHRILRATGPDPNEHAHRVLAQLDLGPPYAAADFLSRLVEIERVNANWAGVSLCLRDATCRGVLLRFRSGSSLDNPPQRRRIVLSRVDATFDLTYVDTWSVPWTFQRTRPSFPLTSWPR